MSIAWGHGRGPTRGDLLWGGVTLLAWCAVVVVLVLGCGGAW